ncbi:hypothetical protein Dsin_006307 [Dipteronia sinensis]|uniref:Uncharacterized protein n=1 Tax=Dipteronia sinensis TaxID=43782 RepID=A0AAE0AYY7_9ROSI|nr:hypothetical protein Dsin_006307 [Dipteronia sinensis]
MPTKLVNMTVIGSIIRDVHLMIYKSVNLLTAASSLVGFDVRLNEMSMPAITFSSPRRTAAKWDLVPPINQNCSFLHHCSISMPDHLISSIVRRQVVNVMTKRYMREVMVKDWTTNWLERRQSAGRKQ